MRRDPRAEARRLINDAVRAETLLDRFDTGQADPECLIAATRHELAEMYHAGFDLAQTISAEFYEELAYIHGYSTPSARERYGHVLDGAVTIESLYDGVVQSPPLRPPAEDLEAVYALPAVDGLGR